MYIEVSIRAKLCYGKQKFIIIQALSVYLNDWQYMLIEYLCIIVVTYQSKHTVTVWSYHTPSRNEKNVGKRIDKYEHMATRCQIIVFLFLLYRASTNNPEKKRKNDSECTRCFDEEYRVDTFFQKKRHVNKHMCVHQ